MKPFLKDYTSICKIKMKRIIIILIGGFYCSVVSAQEDSFVYTYDAVGNRLKREVIQAVPVMLMNTIDSTRHTVQPAIANIQQQVQNTPAFEVRMFPNPTNGLVTLELPELKTGEHGQITVHSQVGKLVFLQKHVTTAQSINLGNLLPGYYVVRVVVSDKMVLTGIIKQ